MSARPIRMLRHLIVDRRGSALLEFGFVAPLLFLLTLGVVDVGRLGLAVSSLEHAAAESARFASVHGNEGASIATSDDVVDFARNTASGIADDEVNVTVTWDPDNSPGSRVTVQITHEFKFLMDPLLPIGSLTLTRASTVTIF